VMYRTTSQTEPDRPRCRRTTKTASPTDEWSTSEHLTNSDNRGRSQLSAAPGLLEHGFGRITITRNPKEEQLTTRRKRRLMSGRFHVEVPQLKTSSTRSCGGSAASSLSLWFRRRSRAYPLSSDVGLHRRCRRSNWCTLLGRQTVPQRPVEPPRPDQRTVLPLRRSPRVRRLSSVAARGDCGWRTTERHVAPRDDADSHRGSAIAAS